MKKVIMGIALALSLTGLGYSGFSIYVAAKENLEKNSLNSQIKELNDKKVKTEASLKDVTEKNIKLKKEYNQLREQRGIKVVYLTFDDGPTPNNTPKILDILKKELSLLSDRIQIYTNVLWMKGMPLRSIRILMNISRYMLLLMLSLLTYIN